MNKKITHVASFVGNIGDNVNHHGFRKWIEKVVNFEPEWVNWEIRELFWGRKSFDDSFVVDANRTDYLVIGGGNFFELWVEHSRTGTSIDISIDRLRRIEKPILINAVGVDIGMGYTQNTVYRFRKFLDVLIEKNSLITVRNDGAIENMREIGLENYIQYIQEVPDGAFYWDTSSFTYQHKSKKFGVNLAGDMLDKRFPKSSNSLSYLEFLDQLALVITRVINDDLMNEVVLFPHIHRDISVISDLLDRLPDPIRRSNVTIFGYQSSSKSFESAVRMYGECRFIIGMRFHANVIPLTHGIPVIALDCYPQITKLFKEIGGEKSCVSARDTDFSKLLTERIVDIVDNNNAALSYAQMLKARALSSKEKHEKAILKWMDMHGE